MPELLCPAGDMERLRTAVQYGADAVYLAGEEFGMRTSPANFNYSQLPEAVSFAHERGVKAFVACNTFPRNDELARMPEFLELAAAYRADAFIVCDLGTMSLVKKHTPSVDIHMSVGTGVVNHLSAREYYNLGAKRVILSRELSLEEIAEIRAKTPKELELEAFVHGAICVSFSGRCLLSNYMTGRDANRGDCAQPCRWKYTLCEEKRPGEFFPVFEDGQGSHILNSKDLNLIRHIPELAAAGISSFKIEGRAKSVYYTAVTANAYRQAIDGYLANPGDYTPEEWIVDELDKISHREYFTGFYHGAPQNGQCLNNGGYIRECMIAAVAEGYKDGMLQLTQRNKFKKGDTLEVLQPGARPFDLCVSELYNEQGEAIEAASHAMMELMIPCGKSVPKGSILRISI